MKSVVDVPLAGKCVLVRVDLNSSSQDETKLRALLPTLNFLLERDCVVVLCSHYGRPHGKPSREDSLAKFVAPLEKVVKTKVTFLPDIGEDAVAKVRGAKGAQIFLLENVRFYRGEEDNDVVFAKSLAKFGDLFVNDAFSVCHRKHASVHAITTVLPSVAGLLLLREVANLKHVRKATWIIGGGKPDKMEFVQQILPKAEKVLLGGVLPFSFMKAQGIEIGQSKVTTRSVEVARKLLRSKHLKKIVLPSDFRTAQDVKPRSTWLEKKSREFDHFDVGLDLGSESIDSFIRLLRGSKAIVWNGPLGMFELAQFAEGTRKIGREVARLTAPVVAGGGETVAALQKFGLYHKIHHVSLGGGAMLAYLSGKPMPGLEALDMQRRTKRHLYKILK